MFIVFITSLLLVLPPLTVSVYLWTSVARFYDEIKHYEKAVKDVSRRHNTMRLVGNLIVNNQSQQEDNFSIISSYLLLSPLKRPDHKWN